MSYSEIIRLKTTLVYAIFRSLNSSPTPRRSIVMMLCLAITTINTSAQKNTAVRQQAWFGYFNQSKLSQRSGIWLDLHYRFTDRFVGERTMLVARGAYIYYAGNRTRIMAGYAYADRYSGNQRIPEHRPWQQIQWVDRKKSFDLTQAFRIEQRFRKEVEDGKVTSEFNFNWRFRYSLSLRVPLAASGFTGTHPFLLISNEININAGRHITNNYLDQNRSFVGTGYQFTPALSANVGYLFIVLQDPAPNTLIYTHAIRLYVVHSLDFHERSKDK